MGRMGLQEIVYSNSYKNSVLGYNKLHKSQIKKKQCKSVVNHYLCYTKTRYFKLRPSLFLLNKSIYD